MFPVSLLAVLIVFVASIVRVYRKKLTTEIYIQFRMI